MKPTLLPRVAALAALILLPGALHAATDVDAKAQGLVDPQYRTEVLFVQGSGTPAGIEKWNYFFYDPTAAHNLRQVQIVNGTVTLSQPSEVSHAVSSDLVFDPARVTLPLASVLKSADTYAQQNQITYNRVRVLLRRPAAGQAPRWRVELLQDDRSRGVIYTGNSAEFVRYAPAGKGDSATAAGFFNDVQNTFKGIGGDLQQFFTGERTVDQ